MTLHIVRPCEMCTVTAYHNQERNWTLATPINTRKGDFQNEMNGFIRQHKGQSTVRVTPRLMDTHAYPLCTTYIWRVGISLKYLLR